LRKGLGGCVALLAAACGGGSTSPSTPAAPPIQVSGAYDIRKTVLTETCGLGVPGDVFTNPGTVQHAAGATAFVLNDHGTRDLPGTLHADGTFDLRPSSSLVMNTIPATDTFDQGRFTATGFTLRDTTDLQASPVAGVPAGPCRVVARWDGAKQGAPNVIP
jgi:hypothetical protein